jgi:hypothetical protein
MTNSVCVALYRLLTYWSNIVIDLYCQMSPLGTWLAFLFFGSILFDSLG